MLTTQKQDNPSPKSAYKYNPSLLMYPRLYLSLFVHLGMYQDSHKKNTR